MLAYSTQEVINPPATERKKNGIKGTTSRRQEIAARFHQKITSKAKGSVTMAVLLRNPKRNKPRAKPQLRLLLPPSNFKYQRVAPKAKNPQKVVLRFVIQATVSTFTGGRDKTIVLNL